MILAVPQLIASNDQPNQLPMNASMAMKLPRNHARKYTDANDELIIVKVTTPEPSRKRQETPTDSRKTRYATSPCSDLYS